MLTPSGMVNTKGNVGLGHLAPSTGSSSGWFWMYAINSGMGNTATLITNQVRHYI